VIYLPAQKPKSDLYRDLLPILNSHRVDLLDHQLTAQIISLERRTARGGGDTIDHAPGAHDDLANVVAGSSALPLGSGSYVADRVGPEGPPYYEPLPLCVECCPADAHHQHVMAVLRAG